MHWLIECWFVDVVLWVIKGVANGIVALLVWVGRLVRAGVGWIIPSARELFRQPEDGKSE